MGTKWINMVDKIKGFKDGDYIEIEYKDGTTKQGFYIRRIDGIGINEYSRVDLRCYRGTYLFRVEREEDDLGDTGYGEETGQRMYVVEQIKDYLDKEWEGEVVRVNTVNYIREETVGELDYINYRLYLKEQDYIKKGRIKEKEEYLAPTIEEWKEMIEHIGIKEYKIEDFIERVEEQIRIYTGVGYVQNGKIGIPTVRSNRRGR